jgi:hypothetical protein
MFEPRNVIGGCPQVVLHGLLVITEHAVRNQRKSATVSRKQNIQSFESLLRIAFLVVIPEGSAVAVADVLAVALASSVSNRCFNVIDDEDRSGLFGRFELKSKLLLDSGEQGRGGVVGGGCIVGSPHELEVVAVSEVGPVDDNSAGNPGKFFSDEPHGKALAIEITAARADTLAAGPG